MRIGGIASGMDTQAMLNELMKAERMPLDRLFQQRKWIEWQRDAYRDVNLKLDNFRNEMGNLRLQATFNAFGAKVADGGIASVKTTSGAVVGNYSLEVTQLAKPATIISENRIRTSTGEEVKGSTNVFSAMGRDAADGTFEFAVETDNGAANGEGKRFATITVEANDTFTSLARKIADAKDSEGKSLGLRTSFDDATGRFVISSKDMGANQTIKMGMDDGGTIKGDAFVDYFITNGAEPILDGNTPPNVTGYQVFDPNATISTPFTVVGQNAKIKMNGIDVESQTNNIRVFGLDITATDVGATTIQVNSDTDKTFDAIKSFVESYNKLIAELQLKVAEPKYRAFPPLTDEERKGLSDKEVELWEEKAKSGLLRSDSILRSVLSDLRNALSSPVAGIPTDEINMLSKIGITTSKDWRNGGILEIDEDKLRQALTEKPDEVMRLFTAQADKDATGNDKFQQSGLGFRVYNALGDFDKKFREKAGAPGLTAKADQSNLGKMLTDFDEKIRRFEDRLVSIENRYWKQFTAMEKAISEMNAQGNSMMGFLFGGMQQ